MMHTEHGDYETRRSQEITYMIFGGGGCKPHGLSDDCTGTKIIVNDSETADVLLAVDCSSIVFRKSHTFRNAWEACGNDAERYWEFCDGSQES